MKKFKFYQDKEIKTWIRDYFTVEADNLDAAIEYVKNMGCTFENDECKKDTKAEFVYRDMDITLDHITNGDVFDDAERYSIFSCDIDEIGEDSEVVRVG